MTVAYQFPGLTGLMVTGFGWATDTVKCALLRETYATASPGTQTYLSEIQAHEVSGAGYTPGGATLTAKTVTGSGTTVRLGAANPTWPTLTDNPRYAVFYRWSGAFATSPLLCYLDAEQVKPASSQMFTVFVPTTGLIVVEGVA